ncbi:MAG TPA: MATE family efflux transporter [Herbaspirillum sp.]|jgi:putative MATE family efflux protein
MTSSSIPASAPQKPLWKIFIAFLIPMIFSNVLQSLSGTVNTIYVGQMLGVNAMAAATSFFPIMFLLIAFVLGLSVGATVLIGQAWGAQDTDRVTAIGTTVLTVNLLLGIAISIGGGIFAEHILRLVETPAAILADATAYARIMFICAPILFLFLLFTSLLRGVGDTVTPLIALALSTAVGLTLTPLLIRGWIGLPPLGVASAAFASASGWICALAWLAYRLGSRNHPLAPQTLLARQSDFNRAILKRVLQIGIPTAVQMIVMALSELALLGMINRFGSEATAAYGAVNQVMAYVQFPAISIAITVSILGSQALGAGRVAQLGGITRTGLVMNLAITGGLVLLGYLGSGLLVRLFIADDAVVTLTQHALHIVLWSSVAYGMAGVFSGMMRASGTVLVPTALSILAILAVEIPVGWFMSHRMGAIGVWVAYPVAYCAMLAMQAAYYWLSWRPRRVELARKIALSLAEKTRIGPAQAEG